MTQPGREKKYDCPTCHQDMREEPHSGHKDCPQCGQGIKRAKRPSKRKEKERV